MLQPQLKKTQVLTHVCLLYIAKPVISSIDEFYLLLNKTYSMMPNKK